MQLAHLPHQDQLLNPYHGNAIIQQMQLAHPQPLFHHNSVAIPLDAGFSGHYGPTPVFQPDPYHPPNYGPSTGMVQAMAAIGHFGMQSQAYGPNQHLHPHHPPSDRPYATDGALDQQRANSVSRGLALPDVDGEEDDNSIEEFDEDVPNLEEYDGI